VHPRRKWLITLCEHVGIIKRFFSKKARKIFTLADNMVPPLALESKKLFIAFSLLC
jgi:hypothetical protein